MPAAGSVGLLAQADLVQPVGFGRAARAGEI